jgi:hypothetical protein
MPHHLVHRFSPKATTAILRGADPAGIPRAREYYAQLPYAGYPGGGVTVLARDTYAHIPLDPRFVGWGQEDQSWALALTCLHGTPWRKYRWPLWHLWHPPQQRMSRAVGSEAGRALLGQYRMLRTDPRRMSAHLEPARRLARETACRQQPV